MCSHQNRLIKAILINKYNIPVWKPFYYLLCKIDILYMLYQISNTGYEISNVYISELVYKISYILYDILYPK